ncbi:MAG: PAS domain S-box protein [Desulfobacteraceae bacterium]|jgi:PAS domain S-box-containing protein
MYEAGTIDIGPMIKTVLVAALVALLSAGIWFYLLQKKAMQEKVEGDLLAIARLKVNQISVWRKDQLDDAAALQKHWFLIQSVARFFGDSSKENKKNLRMHLRSLARQHDYADILFVDPAGKELLSLTGPLHRHSGHAAALARALRTRMPEFIDLHVEAKVPVPHVSVIAPLFVNVGQTQKPIGALILVCDASQFLYPLIEFWPTTSNTAETLIVRQDGDRVVFLNALRHQPDAALKLHIPLHRTDVPAVMAVLGRQGVVIGNDYRGAEVVSAILPIQDSPWFLVAKIDVAEAYADWHLRSILLLALLLGLAALYGLTGLVLWQREKKAHYRALYLSEAALRATVEHHSITLKAIGDAVIATDARSMVKLINPVAEALTGWKDAEARGRPLEEVFRIVNEQTREKVEDPVVKVLREGTVVGLANHTLLIARDGTERPIADSGAPIRDDKGEIIGVVLVFRDQTQERIAAAELAARERYYRSMIFNLHEDILVIDRDYCITDINNTALLTLGLKHAEVVGRKCFEVSHGLNSPCHENGECCALVEVFATGKPSNCLHDHIKSDGTRAHIDIIMSPMKDEDGQVTHVVEAARDISDVIQARGALLQSEEKFRAIFEHMGPGCCLDEIIYKDGKAVDYRILDVNPAYERLIGISRAQAVGALASGLYDTGQAPNIEVYARVDATGDPALFEAFFAPTGKHLQIISSRIAPGRCCTLFSDITERKRAEEERERLLSAIEQAGEMVVITDPEGVIRYVNPAFERTTGYQSKDAVGQTPRILKSGKQELSFYRNLWETITSGRTWEGRIVNMRKDGTLYTEDATISPVCDDAGRILNYVAVKRDVTEHLRLEAQFRQAQKMESVGRLAGGVAHDYNNMLTVIMGHAELALANVDRDQPLYAKLMVIYEAAKRSSEITRQLLAFARKQTISPKVLDLNETVESMLKMLRRLIGEDIDLLWKPGRTCRSIKMDPSQIDQILANLCINARDAIAGMGKITIETGKVTFDEAYCADHTGFVPGEFVLLAVSDDGCGMDKETLDNIFEPFFTTKAAGHGTGLGLATVYGIVKQNEGFINVYSEPEKGTTFRIYLAPHPDQAEGMQKPATTDVPAGNGETVIVVEDDAVIRELATLMLESLGYTVLGAGMPGDALHLAKAHTGYISLLLTDVVMPEMSGGELAKQLKQLCPTIKTLFMSGYTANVIAHRSVLDDGVNFIQKPFSIRDLAVKVRETLDE